MELSITIRKSRPRRWATEIKPTSHGQWNDAPGPSGSHQGPSGSSQTPTDSPQTPMDVVESPADSAPTPTDSSHTLMDSSPTLTDSSPTPMDIAGTPADSAHTPTDSSHTVMDSAQSSTDSPQSPGDPAPTYTEEESFSADVRCFVGPEEVMFLLDKDALYSASSYFKTALDDVGFSEESDQLFDIMLPDEDPDTFLLFQEWINWMPHLLREFRVLDTPDQRWLFLVDLYILADKYGIPDLQNDVMDRLFSSRYSTCPPFVLIQTIYKHTTSRSLPLRRFFVDLFILATNPPCAPECSGWCGRQRCPAHIHEFLLEFADAIFNRGTAAPTSLSDDPETREKYYV